MRHGARIVALGISALLLTLSGCDKVAALDPNRAPTDDEILGAYMQYWNYLQPSADLFTKLRYEDSLQPYSAKQLGNGVTQDTPFGTEYSVTIRFSYRVLRDLKYDCRGGVLLHPSIDPVDADTSASPNTFIAHAGEAFACDENHSFTKVKEGWIYHTGARDDYVIRR